MNIEDCKKYCEKTWDNGGFALEGLKEFIKIPNISPQYDPEFHTNGLQHKMIHFCEKFVKDSGIKGIEKLKVYEDKGREPLLFCDIKGTKPGAPTVLCYGHTDKMPPLEPSKWSQGLHPREPVVRNNKIYGRGSNDDGYNLFCIISALKYLQSKNLPHPRIVLVFESGEESGDEEIVRYLGELKGDIKTPDYILILDCDCCDYNTLWFCKSLRGIINAILEVKHLAQPCHSGMATGLVPSTFRIARMLISRIEDEQTGEIKLKEAHANIPQSRIDMSNAIAKQLGENCVECVSLLDGSKHLDQDRGKLLLNKTWKPGLCVTGVDGVPSVQDGGNVMRTFTRLKLSLRIPPLVDGAKAAQALKKTLEENPPYGAKVSVSFDCNGNGWFGKDFDPKTDKIFNDISKTIFGKTPLLYGEGGSIPLCNTLQDIWPKSQIIVTGCAGPDANPHGYDESLDLPYTKKFSVCICYFLTKISE